MMRKRKTIRLKGYDYTKDNLYFITSCVKDRVCCFGEIISIGTGRDPSIQRNSENASVVGSGRDLTLQQSNGQCMKLNELKIKSLSELLGAYKTTVSKQIHLSGYTEFLWQRSYYEHIIWDNKSFETISTYIINNPLKWDHDIFHGNQEFK